MVENDTMENRGAFLFDPGPEGERPKPVEPSPGGVPRLATAQRHQMELVPQTLDELLPQEHPARAVLTFVERLDLTAFEKQVRAVEGGAGRPACDPRVLLALWVYATAEGIGSGRELDRLTRDHVAFRWLRGGIPLDYHTLNDFRSTHRKEMDDLLTQILALLTKKRLVELKRVAQDGTRVRASAGTTSFHRKSTLERHLAEARAQVEQAARQADHPDPARASRQEAARERAARDRQTRIEQALEQWPIVVEKQKRKTEEERASARVSSTDPDARVMKMGDGGFRPAYNIQFATDTASQVIVGVAVTQGGTDAGELPPMLDQVEARTGRRPEEALVDGGYADLPSLDAAAARKVTVYAPLRPPRKKGIDRHEPRETDSPAVAEWRRRMATEEAKTIYKERAATAECVNAIAKEHRGLRAVRVRGRLKVLGIALLFVITHNILRYVALAGG